MKYFLFISLLFSFSFADEIKRIESIVKDISELRYQYDRCQNKLNLIKNKKLTNQTQKHKYSNNDENYKQKITNLQIQIEKYKNIVIAKNKEIQKLKKLKKTLDRPNEFPKLILKKEYAKYKIVSTKASTYRLKNKANIYSSINGNKVKNWEAGVSFTTNIKATQNSKDSWLRVTGFFVNGSWMRAPSPMWLKAKHAKKR